MIRAGNIADFEALIALGRLFVLESPRYSRLSYSPERVRMHLEHCLEHGFLDVIDINEEVVGALVGMMGKHWFSEAPTCSDLALFIRPDMRGGMAAVRLVGRFAEWAKRVGAVEVQIANSAGIAAQQLERLLNAVGFETVGSICVRKF